MCEPSIRRYPTQYEWSRRGMTSSLPVVLDQRCSVADQRDALWPELGWVISFPLNKFNGTSQRLQVSRDLADVVCMPETLRKQAALTLQL